MRRRRCSRQIALLAVVMLAAGCSSEEDRHLEARERIGDALARGDRREVLSALEALERQAFGNPEAVLELAALTVRAGEAPRALWQLEEGVRRFPERDELRISLANTALLLGDPARALARIEPIGPGSEQHAAALVTRARAFLDLGDLEGALALFAEVERLHPDYPQARLLQISTLLREQRVDEARAALEALEASADSDADRTALRMARIAVFESEIARGQTELGLAGLAALVEDDLEDVHAWRSFVHAHLRAGKIEPALERVEEVLQRHPDQLALYSFAAALHAARGEDEIAQQRLEELVERSESATARIALAQMHASRGRRDASLDLLAETVERFPEDPGAHFAYAEALLSWGLSERGRRAVTPLRAILPADDPQLGYLEARIALAEGEPERARDQLLALIPRFDTAVTQYWLGAAFEASGDATGADRRYRAAVRQDPTLADAHRALLRLAERRGRWREFVEHARLAVRTRPGDPDGWAALVSGLLRLGKAALAEEQARKAVERHPTQRLHLLWVRALTATGRTAEAQAELDRAVAQHGETPEADAERALALARSGRADAALSRIRTARQRNPDVARLHVVEALLLFARSEGDEAGRAVDRALALEPENPEPLRYRAEYHLAHDELDAALEDGLRYLDTRPEDARMHYLVGVIYERLQRAEAAIAAYRRAVELDEQAFLARNNLAELLAERGDVDAALRVAQQAHRLAPDNPYVLDTLGGLYLRKGRTERAISFLEQALEAHPEWQPTRVRLARAYRDSGRVAQAQRVLSESPADEPGGGRPEDEKHEAAPESD